MIKFGIFHTLSMSTMSLMERYLTGIHGGTTVPVQTCSHPHDRDLARRWNPRWFHQRCRPPGHKLSGWNKHGDIGDIGAGVLISNMPNSFQLQHRMLAFWYSWLRPSSIYTRPAHRTGKSFHTPCSMHSIWNLLLSFVNYVVMSMSIPTSSNII